MLRNPRFSLEDFKVTNLCDEIVKRREKIGRKNREKKKIASLQATDSQSVLALFPPARRFNRSNVPQLSVRCSTHRHYHCPLYRSIGNSTGGHHSFSTLNEHVSALASYLVTTDQRRLTLRAESSRTVSRDLRQIHPTTSQALKEH